MMMNFKKVAGAGIAAVTLSLMSSSAMAAIAAGTTVYATQAITGAGVITVPTGATPVVTLGAPTSTGNFTITYTLPAGVTFTATPTLAVAVPGGTAGAGTATFQSGGTGSNAVVFLVNISSVGVAATGTTLTLGNLALTGATALATVNASTFKLSEQVTNSGVAGIANETIASSAQLATSVNAAVLATTTVPTAGTLSVDITGSSGTKFINATPATALAYGDDGLINFSVSGTAKQADGATAYAFTSTTVSETLTGNTGGLTGAYLNANGTNACAATYPGTTGTGTPGTIAAGGNTIVFPGLGIATGAREVCLYGSGTSLLAANPNGFAVTATIDATTVGGFNTAPYSYNGVTANFAYATNATAYYQEYIRITNTGTKAIPVTASVTTDAGVGSLATVETALAAGASDLVPISTIATNAGSVSANGRFSVSMFGPTGTLFENLVVNPGGVVTEFSRTITTQ
jgi:hypothetical protein